jgi:hypothetical protein
MGLFDENEIIRYTIVAVVTIIANLFLVPYFRETLGLDEKFDLGSFVVFVFLVMFAIYLLFKFFNEIIKEKKKSTFDRIVSG